MKSNEVRKGSAGSFLNLTGVLSAVLGVITIAVSVHLNPWFRITSNAFSDLGSNRADYQWVFNYGMIATSAMMFVYSLHLISVSRNKVQSVGGTFVLVASVFLALIGYFHEGTYPHYFVSVYFFTQMDFAILTWGIGFLYDRRIALAGVFILSSIVGSVTSLVVKFPSVALLEAYGISIILLWVILMAIYFSRPKRIE